MRATLCGALLAPITFRVPAWQWVWGGVRGAEYLGLNMKGKCGMNSRPPYQRWFSLEHRHILCGDELHENVHFCIQSSFSSENLYATVHVAMSFEPKSPSTQPSPSTSHKFRLALGPHIYDYLFLAFGPDHVEWKMQMVFFYFCAGGLSAKQ